MVANRGGLPSCKRSNPRDRWRLAQQLSHPAQILGGNRQQELIPCTTYPAQPQLIQFQDPLEMRKQHLGFSRSLQAGEEVEVIIHVSSCPEFDCNDGAGQSARTLKSFFGVVFPTW